MSQMRPAAGRESCKQDSFSIYHFLEKQDKTGYIKANAKTENKRAGRKKILHKKEDKTKMWKQKKGRDTNDFFRLFRNGVCL